MKTCFHAAAVGWIALGWAAFAQSPVPPKVSDDKVVAKIDGKDVTAGEVYDALRAMPPQFVPLYNQNPKYALQQLFMMRFLAAEAEKNKLGDRSPYREQLQAQRADVLASAMLSYLQDHFEVSEESVQKYYDDHKDTYQQAKLRAISIRFKQVAPLDAPFEVRARIDLENGVGNVQRSEEEARTRAIEVVEKLKGGADFAKLVEQYSDDLASRPKGGDFGVATNSSSHPDEIKQAVAKLKAGEVSDPVRLPNAYLVVRVDEKSALPRNQVEGSIIEGLRKVQLKAWFDDVTHRFEPKVESPEFFTQPAPVPSLQAPSLPPAPPQNR